MLRKIRKRGKKGQAAMEFLMTYGWAILAAIIAIGVLAYFGVFSPGRLAGSIGIVNAPFVVDNFNIVDGTEANPDVINIEVTQNLGSSITLRNSITGASDAFMITLTGAYDGDCEMTVAAGEIDVLLSTTSPSADASWPSGTQVQFVATCTAVGNWAAGDQISGDISIVYRTGSSSIDQSSSGNVRGVSQ